MIKLEIKLYLVQIGAASLKGAPESVVSPSYQRWYLAGLKL